MSEKKRIFIMSHALELGGAERSLIGLLDAIDTQKYEVDLFLMRHEGELLSYIPETVNLLPEVEEYTCLAVPIERVIKKGKIGVAMGRTLGKAMAKRFSVKNNVNSGGAIALEYSHKYTKRYMPDISDEEYDLAISFLTPHYFVSEKVKAKKKLAWIHTDYSYIDIDVCSEEKMWTQYDNIVSISNAVTKSFLSKFPRLESRILEIENIVSPKFIKEQAKEFEIENEMPRDGGISILSIGRFCEAKNFDNVPTICRYMKEHSDIKFRWYLIGFGFDEKLIRKRIEEEDMLDTVIILGKKNNPYPYINACDIYIQPSRYEGKAVTVKEAQILGKPVIITNYTTAQSQVEDGVDGLIVPLDNLKCAKEIIKTIRNPKIIEQLSEHCYGMDYDNSKDLGKIYSLLEN